MKKYNKKTKVLILAVLLFIISSTFIILIGNTYTIKYDNINGINDINDINNLNIKIENENIVECIDKRIENGFLKIKIKSKLPGKTFISIKNSNNDFYTMFSIYVHKFGIISFNEYMGDCSGIIIIPISIIILLGYILFLLIKSYKQSIKKNMYQYKNIAYLGMIVFVFFTVISQILSLFNYNGLIDTITDAIALFSFAKILFPIIFFVSILVILSNISLVRKEGFNIRNILGIALGLFLCFFTALPDILYKTLNSATWIDIHNQNGIDLYVYSLIETIINIVITYIECILIGTIIMGIKSAKHIPSFDKDAILILGCQMKKDGTLTRLLKSRTDRAIEFSKMQKDKSNKDIIFVPTGGKGTNEIISEAQAIKNYLIEHGIKEDKILIEDKSKNTFENIKFSNRIIKEKIKNAKIALSTTNYHVFRAGNIAAKQNLYIEGIGAKTKSYFWINAFIREFIATLYNEKRKHIITICTITLIAILMILITYFNNII